MNSTEKDCFDKGCYFSITVILRHPFIDPDLITDELKLEPIRCWKAGEERTSPQGDLLKGKWPDTRWICSLDFFETRKFYKKIAEIIDQLYEHRCFFKKLNDDGADLSLNLGLPGKINIGSSLPISAMAKMVEMQMELGVEVFPDWVLDEEE